MGNQRKKTAEAKSSSLPQIATAVIGLVGVALTAILTNWDRLWPKPLTAAVPESQSVVGKAHVELSLDPQPVELGATLHASLQNNPNVGQSVFLQILVNGQPCTQAMNYRNPQQSGVLTTTASCSVRIPPNQRHVFSAGAPNQSHDQESLSLDVKYGH